MKKLITLCIALFVSAVMFAQNLPAFTESENAYVFDAKTLKEDFGDACKIVNLTFEKDLTFDVYLMKSNKKKWLHAGEATVSGILDSCVLESEYDGDYDDYRYFALVPKDDRKYNVTFTYDNVFMYAFSKESCVFLVDMDVDTPSDVRSNSTIIDVNSVKGKFKDNIKLINKSSDSNMDFYIFGFDSPDATKWNAVGKGDLKGFDDSDSIDTIVNDSSNMKKYAYYAVYAANGKKYDVNPSKAHNDLIIEIQ